MVTNGEARLRELADRWEKDSVRLDSEYACVWRLHAQELRMALAAPVPAAPTTNAESLMLEALAVQAEVPANDLAVGIARAAVTHSREPASGHAGSAGSPNAAQAEVESRSVQRRKALQRGEPMPTFEASVQAEVDGKP